MGTVNYKTSELITIASPAPRYFEDYRLGAEEEARETGEDVDEIIDRWIEIDEEDAWTAAKDAASRFYGNFYGIKAEPGYYQGTQLYITVNTPDEIDDDERAAALEEIGQLEQILLELCRDYDFYETFPGWCTGRSNYAETLEAISRAADEERARIEALPAWTPERWTA